MAALLDITSTPLSDGEHRRLSSLALAALDGGRNRTIPAPRVRAAGTLLAAALLLGIAGATPTLDASAPAHNVPASPKPPARPPVRWRKS